MPFTTHNQRMVDRFLWLEALDLKYARWALEQYQNDLNSPNPNILADVKAEKARRAQSPTSSPVSPSK